MLNRDSYLFFVWILVIFFFCEISGKSAVKTQLLYITSRRATLISSYPVFRRIVWGRTQLPLRPSDSWKLFQTSPALISCPDLCCRFFSPCSGQCICYCVPFAMPYLVGLMLHNSMSISVFVQAKTLCTAITRICSLTFSMCCFIQVLATHYFKWHSFSWLTTCLSTLQGPRHSFWHCQQGTPSWSSSVNTKCFTSQGQSLTIWTISTVITLAHLELLLHVLKFSPDRFLTEEAVRALTLSFFFFFPPLCKTQWFVMWAIKCFILILPRTSTLCKQSKVFRLKQLDLLSCK